MSHWFLCYTLILQTHTLQEILKDFVLPKHNLELKKTRLLCWHEFFRYIPNTIEKTEKIIKDI